jgi:hypothetical protein
MANLPLLLIIAAQPDARQAATELIPHSNSELQRASLFVSVFLLSTGR